MKSKFFSLFVGASMFGALLPVVAQANDSAASGVGGRWHMMTKEHPSIRMVRETVDLYVGAKTYVTIANFTFHNSGPATTVQMGFPESAYGDFDRNNYKTKSGFKNFTTSVDGRTVPVQRHVTSIAEDSADALWVKTVPFKAGQTHAIRVKYESEMGDSSTYPHSFVTYAFTGANWQGKVDSSVLTVHFDVPGTYLVEHQNDPKEIPQFKRLGNLFIYTWKNWQAQSDFDLHFGSTLRNWMTNTGSAPDSGEPMLPIKIDLPGKKIDESHVEWAPTGVERDGKIYVNLHDWLDWAGQKRGIKNSYDAKTHTVVAVDGARSVRFSATAKDGSFTISDASSVAPVLYVPATRLTSAFNAHFEARPKDHVLKFVN